MCQENKRHKHADLIIAWANGAEIQFLNQFGKWQDTVPSWSTTCDYRIKPKPSVKKYLLVYLVRGALRASVTDTYWESIQQYENYYPSVTFDFVEAIQATEKEFSA
jgi:hypothetical protein